MKRVIAALSGLFAAAVVGLAPVEAQDRTPDFGGVTLRVATFPGSWPERIREEIGPQIEAAGIKLEFVAGQSSEFLAQLVAAKGQNAPFDVVEIGDETYYDFRQAGFLKPINLANVPNTRELEPKLFDEYRVAYWLSQPSIIYNVDKFAEAGVVAPTRFSDLTNSALHGRVLVPDIASYNVYFGVTALAYENGGSETDPAAGFEALKAIRAHSATASAGTVAQLFQSGEVWAAIWPAHVATRLHAHGVNVSVVHPPVRDKRVALARGYFGLVASSQQQEAAEFFINAVLQPKVQQRFHTEAGLTPVHRVSLAEASALAAKDNAGTVFLRQDPDDIANAWWPDFSVIDKRKWARQFQEAIGN